MHVSTDTAGSLTGSPFEFGLIAPLHWPEQVALNVPVVDVPVRANGGIAIEAENVRTAAIPDAPPRKTWVPNVIWPWKPKIIPPNSCGATSTPVVPALRGTAGSPEPGGTRLDGTSTQVPFGSKLRLLMHTLNRRFTGGRLTITLRPASGVAADADDGPTIAALLAITRTRTTSRCAATSARRRKKP